jgi:hypothetical protein
VNSHKIRACLFDMDGTFLDSSKSFDRIWGRWAERNGVSYAKVAAAIHGARAVDIIKRILPSCGDPEAEAQAIVEEELTDLADIAAISGAKEFLAKLPERQWTIVTSASRQLACADSKPRDSQSPLNLWRRKTFQRESHRRPAIVWPRVASVANRTSAWCSKIQLLGARQLQLPGRDTSWLRRRTMRVRDRPGGARIRRSDTTTNWK